MYIELSGLSQFIEQTRAVFSFMTTTISIMIFHTRSSLPLQAGHKNSTSTQLAATNEAP